MAWVYITGEGVAEKTLPLMNADYADFPLILP
jgi:hypothetical protein